MSREERPVVAITMGDPAGNGPELCVKALSDAALYDRCRPLVVGDAGVIDRARGYVGHSEVRVNAVSEVSGARFVPGVIDVLDLALVPDAAALQLGRVSAEAGWAAFESVRTTIELALAGEVDATVTNALNKEALNLALGPRDMHFDGHTEIYAHYTHTASYAMMLCHHDFRVAHVSTHCSLREACERVRTPRVLEVIRLAWRACRDLGIERPRVAVAGLNPHAGENGLFGTEEVEEIIPAIEAARSEGIDARGPLPPDSVFPEMNGGWYDIVVCMYHDQGHIPTKMLGFRFDRERGAWDAVEGVNVTLGLPIIRTSVDHGTGFALAGTGESSERSLVNAIDYAIRLSSGRPSVR